LQEWGWPEIDFTQDEGINVDMAQLKKIAIGGSYETSSTDIQAGGGGGNLPSRFFLDLLYID